MRFGVIQVSPGTDEARRVWVKVGQLAGEFGADESWCLIGGLMVQLYSFEYGSDARPTRDIDVLGAATRRPSGTEKLAKTLKRLGAEVTIPPRTDAKLGYRFELDGELVEVLGPEGLKTSAKTINGLETIMVKGGRQALQRTEKVRVSIADTPPVVIRRPTLLGAILIKTRAMSSSKKKRDAHRQDLIRLLTFVEDPRQLAEDDGLTKTERKWLRQAEKILAFDDPDLPRMFTADQIQRASQSFEILVAARSPVKQA